MMRSVERSQHHRLIQSALLAAVCAAIGYLFLALPNFEFITAAIFISGYLMGPLYGLIIGLTAELIFSLFNPYGAPSLPLLLAQICSMAAVGLAGGFAGKARWLERRFWLQALLFGLSGFMLTTVYDTLSTLSFAVFMAEGDVRKIGLSFLSGMSFYLVHIVINTVSFAMLVPLLLKRVRRLI